MRGERDREAKKKKLLRCQAQTHSYELVGLRCLITCECILLDAQTNNIKSEAKKYTHTRTHTLIFSNLCQHSLN